MRLKSIIEGLNKSNSDLSRPLLESIVVPEVTSALKDWANNANPSGVLIGGLATSFYVKPQQTMDVDVIYLTDQEIPNTVLGFKRIREHAFQHNNTHVEVEVLSPGFFGIPESLVKIVIDTAIESNGMKIANKSGLIALKLQRGNLQDQAHIEKLIQSGGINISPFEEWLTDNQIALYKQIERNA